MFQEKIKRNIAKIAKIDECLIEDTGKQLINSFYATDGSLTTIPEVMEETVLCNSYEAALKCESFNGETIRAISDVKVQHGQACMSIYLEQAVIIAGAQSSSVEILEFRFLSKSNKFKSILADGKT